MKYNICSACVHFNPSMVNRVASYPSYCSHDVIKSFFGLQMKGFIPSTDVVHCDYFEQWPIDYCDCKITTKDGFGVAFINKQGKGRNFRIPELYDNSKNIKTHFFNN